MFYWQDRQTWLLSLEFLDVFLFFGWGNWGLGCPIPRLGCGDGLFFGLGCFSVCVGMGDAVFLSHPLHEAMLGGLGCGWGGMSGFYF
jgi:hypothetical protein